MLYDIKLNIGRVLVIPPEDPKSIHQIDFDKDMMKIVSTSRCRYDAVILLDSASKGLNALSNIRRSVVTEAGFKPMIVGSSDGPEIGMSYWLLEFK